MKNNIWFLFFPGLIIGMLLGIISVILIPINKEIKNIESQYFLIPELYENKSINETNINKSVSYENETYLFVYCESKKDIYTRALKINKNYFSFTDAKRYFIKNENDTIYIIFFKQLNEEEYNDYTYTEK